MTYKTHTTMALVSTLALGFLPTPYNPYYYIQNPLYFPLVFAIAFVSSLAPDFDEPGSYLSSRFPWIIVSHILAIFVTHRGVTHRILAVPFYGLIIYGILMLLNQEKELWILAIFGSVAYFMHLVGDGMTRGGLPRFYYPFSKKTIWFLPKSMRFYTGSFIEMILLFLFLCTVIAEIYFLFILNQEFVSNLLILT